MASNPQTGAKMNAQDPQVGAKMAPEPPKLVPKWTQDPPFGSQKTARTPNLETKWPHDLQLGLADSKLQKQDTELLTPDTIHRTPGSKHFTDKIAISIYNKKQFPQVFFTFDDKKHGDIKPVGANPFSNECNRLCAGHADVLCTRRETEN